MVAVEKYYNTDRLRPIQGSERHGVEIGKGLEFPFVFISGLEDGLFPLARAYDEPDAIFLLCAALLAAGIIRRRIGLRTYPDGGASCGAASGDSGEA